MGERDFNVGDRIFGMARTHGAYAEYTAVVPGVRQNRWPVSLTASLTNRQLRCPSRRVTALGSLDLLGLPLGKHLVVMGATGGVGGYAVQMARSRGVHVIATVRGDADRLAASEPKKCTTPKLSSY